MNDKSCSDAPYTDDQHVPGSADDGESPPGEEEGVEINAITLPPTKRVIDLFGPVSDKMQHQVRRAISRFEREGDDTVLVRINTNGGRVDVAYAVHDLLAASAVPIVTAVYGNAYSAGSIILQAGNVRCLTPHSAVMIHLGTWFLQSGMNVDEMGKLERAMQFEENRADSILAERSGQNIDVIRAWNREDKYMTAIEAVQLNFADAIIIPRDLESEPTERSWHSRFTNPLAKLLESVEHLATIADFFGAMGGVAEDDEDDDDDEKSRLIAAPRRPAGRAPRMRQRNLEYYLPKTRSHR